MTEPPTSKRDHIEGPEAFRRFDDFMDKLLQVPRSTIKRGITVHRKKAAKNPRKRGPKPKKRG